MEKKKTIEKLWLDLVTLPWILPLVVRFYFVYAVWRCSLSCVMLFALASVASHDTFSFFSFSATTFAICLLALNNLYTFTCSKLYYKLTRVLDFDGIRYTFLSFLSLCVWMKCFSFQILQCLKNCVSIAVCLQCVLSHVIPKRVLYLWLLFKNVRDMAQRKCRREKNTHIRLEWKKKKRKYCL